MGFCDKHRARIRKALKKFGEFAEDHVEMAITIASGLRDALKSEAAITITGIIPGKWDDKIREKGVEITEEILDGLGIIDACKDVTGDEKLQCYADHLLSLLPKSQNKGILAFASAYLAKLDGNRFPENTYDSAIQVAYSLNHPGTDDLLK